jgi:hypothetical protein
LPPWANPLQTWLLGAGRKGSEKVNSERNGQTRRLAGRSVVKVFAPDAYEIPDGIMLQMQCRTILDNIRLVTVLRLKNQCALIRIRVGGGHEKYASFSNLSIYLSRGFVRLEQAPRCRTEYRFRSVPLCPQTKCRHRNRICPWHFRRRCGDMDQSR